MDVAAREKIYALEFVARTEANCNFWTGAHFTSPEICDEIGLGDHWCGASKQRPCLATFNPPTPLRQHRPVRINSPLRDLWFPRSGLAASALFWPELWWWFMSCKWLLKSGPTHTFHCNSLFSYWSPPFFFDLGLRKACCARKWTEVCERRV